MLKINPFKRINPVSEKGGGAKSGDTMLNTWAKSVTIESSVDNDQSDKLVRMFDSFCVYVYVFV